MRERIKPFIYLIPFMLSLAFFLSCNDNDVSNPAEIPPEKPPVSTLSIDFNQFPITGVLPKVNENADNNYPASNANWKWASFNVIAWQTKITAGMIIPVAAFIESFNHEPEKQDDSRWLWTYEFTPFSGIKYTASLYADVGLTSIIWEMYISKEGQFTDFLWYSGESDLLATEGTWTIYAEPSSPTQWIGIEWHRSIDNGTADIKYTNIKPNDEESGGYIHFGITDEELYNAFYEIFNKGQNNIVSVRWNKTSKAGSVMDLNHFGDSEWHCWDENLDDADCP
jgi:hypothetical protein